MKYFLLITALFLAFCGLFSYFYEEKLPKEFTDLVEKQPNPFMVPKDSSAIIWQRAKDFLKRKELMIIGGNLKINDSVIYMPYYNDYHRGNSMRFERHDKGDSVQFFVIWWYSGDSGRTGTNEIALYMQQGIERYSFIRQLSNKK
jgi:hypothetical protein